MAIARYRDPGSFFGLQRLNRILDEAFAGAAFGEQGDVITSTWFAPTDVSEDDNSLRITMELPGVNPDDVRLSLENNILTIRGEKKHEEETSHERIHRFERTYGMFERTFALPNTVDPDRIEAQYENGVLQVTLHKAERAKPREIRVNASSQGSTQVKASSQSQRAVGQDPTSKGGTRQGAEIGTHRDPEEEGSAGRTSR